MIDKINEMQSDHKRETTFLKNKIVKLEDYIQQNITKQIKQEVS